MQAVIQPKPGTFTAETASNGHRANVRNGKRALLNHALEVEQISFKALQELSQSGDDPEQVESNRAHATAITNIVRAWDAGMERIRILRGEPMPGSRRPLPDEKRKPKRSLNRPPAPKQSKVQEPVPAISQTEPETGPEPGSASK